MKVKTHPFMGRCMEEAPTRRLKGCSLTIVGPASQRGKEAAGLHSGGGGGAVMQTPLRLRGQTLSLLCSFLPPPTGLDCSQGLG